MTHCKPKSNYVQHAQHIQAQAKNQKKNLEGRVIIDTVFTISNDLRHERKGAIRESSMSLVKIKEIRGANGGIAKSPKYRTCWFVLSKKKTHVLPSSATMPELFISENNFFSCSKYSSSFLKSLQS